MKPDIIFPYEYWGLTVLSGHVQMALEEFLLKRVARVNEKPENRVAAVRFYSFPQDTIVLAYGQNVDPIKKQDASFAVTRRITGGSHIQTGSNTLAYTFVIPRDGTFATYKEMRGYYADLVTRALKKLGVGPIESDNQAAVITVNGRIIASHSAFWGVRSALLHGLITLHPYDVDKIAERLTLLRRKIGNHFYSEYTALKKLPAISQELEGKMVRSLLTPERLRKIVADAILQEVTDGNHKKHGLTGEVMAEVIGLVKQKYGALPWINERRPVYTPEEVEAISGEDQLAGPLRDNQGYCLFYRVSDDDFKNMADPE